MTAQPPASTEKALCEAALDYHSQPTPGKIKVVPTKPLSNQRDLSLAYSPGVAYACLAIHEAPERAMDLTSRANLVAVVTNGTAVLGLGDIGPLASKPVMEGKGCLFHTFAGIDVFDIELAERDPDKLVDMIAALEPTVGGINLEDIKAPECFAIEKKLSERMNIPVFHDDQHGTAIICAAALLNALELVNKPIDKIKFVVSGAGAAAISCLDLMVQLGVSKKQIIVCDSKGVIHDGREEVLDASKQRYQQTTSLRTLAEAIVDADVFLGCSTAGVLTPAMVKRMACQPIILALANPEPEIRPEQAQAVRPDCLIATGRSDYPNQVNNVLCFPYIFRGALDCGATRITNEMKLACVYEIAKLAKAEISEEVAAAYAGQALQFGPNYLIPKPFDQRLIARIAPAVAAAAAHSGVAARPIQDLAAYRQSLTRFVCHTGMLMAPVFNIARRHAENATKRIVYAEGEDERVLRAVQIALEEQLVKPILIGRPAVIEARIAHAGLRLQVGVDVELINAEEDSRFHAYKQTYRGLKAGATLETEKMGCCANTAIAAMMVRQKAADGLLAGLVGRFEDHLGYIRDLIGQHANAACFAAMNGLVLDRHTLFIADTFVNEDPTAVELADMACQAVVAVQSSFHLSPKVAFLSHSMLGSSERSSAKKMRQARDLFLQRMPQVLADGEIHGDAALDEAVRAQFLPTSTLTGSANILMMPNLDAANILFNVLKVTSGQGVTIGPILLGAAAPAHVLTPVATVRRIVNMTALVASYG